MPDSSLSLSQPTLGTIYMRYAYGIISNEGIYKIFEK